MLPIPRPFCGARDKTEIHWGDEAPIGLLMGGAPCSEQNGQYPCVVH